MPITNLNNKHLTAEQLVAAQDALTNLESALVDIDFNLTSEDRQKYGSINEQNKLIVNKVNDYLLRHSQGSIGVLSYHKPTFFCLEVFSKFANSFEVEYLL